MTTHNDNDHELRYWTTASTVVQFPTTISFRIRMLYLFLPYYQLLFIVVFSRVSPLFLSLQNTIYSYSRDEVTRDASATRVHPMCILLLRRRGGGPRRSCRKTMTNKCTHVNKYLDRLSIEGKESRNIERIKCVREQEAFCRDICLWKYSNW